MEVPEGEEKEESFELLMVGSFLQLMTDTKPQIHEAQRTPGRINSKK